MGLFAFFHGSRARDQHLAHLERQVLDQAAVIAVLHHAANEQADAEAKWELVAEQLSAIVEGMQAVLAAVKQKGEEKSERRTTIVLASMPDEVM